MTDRGGPLGFGLLGGRGQMGPFRGEFPDRRREEVPFAVGAAGRGTTERVDRILNVLQAVRGNLTTVKELGRELITTTASKQAVLESMTETLAIAEAVHRDLNNVEGLASGMVRELRNAIKDVRGY